MEQLINFGDERQTAFCAHCGGSTETRDHVPSRVLLDEPFPENLPVIVSCRACNEAFSKDEEYVSCLVECARFGSTDVADLERAKIRRLLASRPALASRLSDAQHGRGPHTRFVVEVDRVRNVVLKLARGHALFELNAPEHGEPSSLFFRPLDSLTPEDRSRFEQPPVRVLWPEVGSRGMQRMAQTGTPKWITVQPERYRYLAYVDHSSVIRFVLSEYLACEVSWTFAWEAPPDGGSARLNC